MCSRENGSRLIWGSRPEQKSSAKFWALSALGPCALHTLHTLLLCHCLSTYALSEKKRVQPIFRQTANKTIKWQSIRSLNKVVTGNWLFAYAFVLVWFAVCHLAKYEIGDLVSSERRELALEYITIQFSLAVSFVISCGSTDLTSWRNGRVCGAERKKIRCPRLLLVNRCMRLRTDKGGFRWGGARGHAPRCQILCNMTLKQHNAGMHCNKKRHQRHQIMTFIFTWP